MNIKGMLATKPIAEYQKEASDKSLKRALGIPALIAFGIGGIIGTGIFVLTGLAAAQHAGPAIVLSFVLAGVGCMFAGLCYSEFATMVPVAGSAYAYSYATLGEFIAWFVGWNLILEYMMAASTVAVGWSRYFVKLLDHYHINFIPAVLSSAPFAAGDAGFQVHSTGAIVNLPAIAIVGAATWLCYKGIRESAIVNTIIVAIKVSIVLAVIIFGMKYINTSNWHPYIPENTGTFGEFGLSGIAMASAIIFFAYIGFDGVSTVAQEAKNPQRDLPIGMLGSLAICTVLYILMSSVMTGLVPFKQLNDAAPVAVALESHSELAWLSTWVIWGALFGLTSVIITMIIPQARIWLTMSHDGLLPKFFGKVHPKFRTPSTGTVVTAVTAAVIGGLFPVGVLGHLVSIGTLAAFVTVCVGVLVLRRTRPDLPRPFRAPAPWFTCTAGAIICGAMMLSLGSATWIRLVVWTIVGALIYAFYGYRNSRLHRAGT
jgi:APA family basic amino acid/polyamine antiporter